MSRGRGGIAGAARVVSGCALTWLWVVVLCAPRPAAAATFLDAAESAQATVTGVVRSVERLDEHGYAAVLELDGVLAGSLAPGGPQRIGWQELSTQRPPRLAEGERVLVALEPLPAGSLWRARFPDGDALALGARGGAVLKDPDEASIAALTAYLALEPSARKGAAGVGALLTLAHRASPQLAAQALARLGEGSALRAPLDPVSREVYAELLADAGRPRELRADALELAGQRRLQSLRGSVAALTQPGSGLEASAWTALARIDGGLPPETARRLLQSPDPELRALALDHAGSAVDGARLEKLLKEDPAGPVRVAAAQALLAQGGVGALDAVLPGLFDPDPKVCRDVAIRIAALGDAAVPRLREILAERPYGEISELAPVALALAQAGPAGRGALQQIAAENDDPKRRKLAGLLLGRLPEPGH